jgi:hypothetical protein
MVRGIVATMDRSRALPALLAGCLMFAVSSPTFAAEPPGDALPRYDDPVPVLVDPPEGQDGPPLRAVPNDGRGMLAAGGILMTVGGSAVVTSIVLATDRNPDPVLGVPPWITFLVVGTVGTTVGSVLLGLGVSKHRAYRQWEAQQAETIPRQGHGLVGSGSILLGLGVFGTVVSGTVWASQTSLPFYPERIPPAQAGVGLGLTSIAVGTTLLVTGAVRNKRFGAWRRATSVALAPTLVPTRSGLHLGIVGRF